MKTLMLLRHAKSSWKNDRLGDHERPLNKRGKAAAPAMGRLVLEKNVVPDLIYSSTAVRAHTTAKAVAKACGYRGEIRTSEQLYLATAGTLMEHAERRVEDSVNRLMLVAHNPGMGNLVQMLSKKHEPFPTGALAVFEVPIDSWRDLALGLDFKMTALWRPRELNES